MKKILLLVSTTALFASTTMAGPASTAYVKAAGGVNKVANKITTNINSKAVGFAEVGIGYNISNNFRTDLTYTHLFSPKYKFSNSYNIRNLKIDFSEKMKIDLDTFLLNGYIDLFDLGPAKFYIGGGLGFAMVKYNHTANRTETNIDTKVVNKTSTPKKVNEARFAYGLTLGASTEISQAVSLEIAYNFRSIQLDTEENKYVKVRHVINSHNGSVGVRFSL